MLEPSEKADQMGEDGVMYDFAGRKVQKGQKGIYIQNGKKVMIQ